MSPADIMFDNSPQVQLIGEPLHQVAFHQRRILAVLIVGGGRRCGRGRASQYWREHLTVALPSEVVADEVLEFLADDGARGVQRMRPWPTSSSTWKSRNSLPSLRWSRFFASSRRARVAFSASFEGSMNSRCEQVVRSWSPRQ